MIAFGAIDRSELADADAAGVGVICHNQITIMVNPTSATDGEKRFFWGEFWG